jgi:hypothetical protein
LPSKLVYRPSEKRGLIIARKTRTLAVLVVATHLKVPLM